MSNPLLWTLPVLAALVITALLASVIAGLAGISSTANQESPATTTPRAGETRGR